MKATGIVRRIDDLGRVVIPKEIRRTLRIKEGTPLEIFTDREGEIILKKYSPIGELSLFAKEYAESLSHSTGMLSCITDHDQVVAAAGPGSKEFIGKLISSQLEAVINDREAKCLSAKDRGKVPAPAKSFWRRPPPGFLDDRWNNNFVIAAVNVSIEPV